MAGDLCFFIGIVVFWGLAHFQDAAVLMADRPLTYLQAEPLTDVNTDETHSLHREKEPKESRFKRHSGENNEWNKIMETLTSRCNALKEQIDERVKADDEQSGISNSLRNDLTKLEGRAERQERAIGRLRDELASNITSLQDGLELQVIEYENLTSAVFRLGEKLENEESNFKKLAPNVSLLQREMTSQSEMVDGLTSGMGKIEGRLVDQEQMDDQHSANISHIGIELEKLTKAYKNITSNIDDLQEEFASRTAEVRNNLTLAVGSLEERLDHKENTDGILVTNVTSLQERLNRRENMDTLITSNLTSLQGKLATYLTGLQENLTTDIASLLTRLERLESTKSQESKWVSRDDLKQLESKLDTYMLFCQQYKYQSSCYNIVHDKLSWYGAKEKCRKLGGKLAEIESSGENNYIKQIVAELRTENLWLGGTDQMTEGNWVWASSNTVIQFKDWYGVEPNNKPTNEDCLELRQFFNYMWNDNDCQISLMSLCEISPGSL